MRINLKWLACPFPSLLFPDIPIKCLKSAHKQFKYRLGEWTVSSSSSKGDLDKENLSQKKLKLSLNKREEKRRQE